jgi:coenzyme F420-0:L-glutamate ligase / coenzyme F420-1:gamma-L-glutamate ligase
MAGLVLSLLEGIPFIRQGNDLADIVLNTLTRMNLELVDEDILVFTQKIISKAEGRMVNLADITPSPSALRYAELCGKDPRLVELILAESKSVVRVQLGVIIVEHRLGFVCANAGIDHSNVQEDRERSTTWVLQLPENPDVSAERLRVKIESETNTKLGVLIIDSHGRAWRNGTTGVAIGLSGMPGLVDLRGKPDLFGQQLSITTVGAADELAAAASLAMGQADEGTPVVHVRGFPYSLRDGDLNELLRPKEQDLFR